MPLAISENTKKKKKKEKLFIDQTWRKSSIMITLQVLVEAILPLAAELNQDYHRPL